MKNVVPRGGIVNIEYVCGRLPRFDSEINKYNDK